MNYKIIKYISTLIDGRPVDLVAGVKNANGNYLELTLLQIRELKRLGETFVVGDLQLVAYYNLKIEEGVIKNASGCTSGEISAIIDCIEYAQRYGWASLNGREPQNPRQKIALRNKEDLLSGVDVSALREQIAPPKRWMFTVHVPHSGNLVDGVLKVSKLLSAKDAALVSVYMNYGYERGDSEENEASFRFDFNVKGDEQSPEGLDMLLSKARAYMADKDIAIVRDEDRDHIYFITCVERDELNKSTYIKEERCLHKVISADKITDEIARQVIDGACM